MTQEEHHFYPYEYGNLVGWCQHLLLTARLRYLDDLHMTHIQGQSNNVTPTNNVIIDNN